MIMCAGLGTRLGELSDVWPKPLLPMADMPIVRYGIALLAGHGIRDIVVNLHYKPELFERVLGNGSQLGVRIHYSHEPEILGTGGGIKRALPLLDPDGTDEPFVVMNGKLVIDADVSAVLAAYRAAGDALGAMLVQRLPDGADFGRVDVDDRMRVRNILGPGQYMFCGIHVTRPSVMQALPDGEACSVRQGYLPWIQAGRGEVVAVEHAGYFAEHSTPGRYREGNIAVVRGAGLRFPPGPTSGIDPTANIALGATVIDPVRIGPGATVQEDATVGPDAVIGTGAVVGAGVTVERSVVWAHARVDADARDAVITGSSATRAT